MNNISKTLKDQWKLMKHMQQHWKINENNETHLENNEKSLKNNEQHLENNEQSPNAVPFFFKGFQD